MKKNFKYIISLMLLLLTSMVLVGCGDDSNDTENEVYYVAAADFFYSEDKGHSYGNGRKEYEIGETVYMMVKAKVTSNQEIPQTIKMKLTIPNITAVDSKYYDGQPITPKLDTVKNVTVYEFTITAALNAQEWKFVFQFIPNTEAEVKMLLEFDDNVDKAYDKQNTIKFISTKEEE